MKYKAIIVEDDRIVRSYMSNLEVWGDYDIEIVDSARDGVEALEKNQQLHPDLIITDISMPQMNGIELIKEIRAIDQSVYIMVLSCHDEFEYVKEAMKLGANEYVLKNTFSEETLAEILPNTVKSMQQQTKTQDHQFYAKQDLKFYFFNQMMAGMLSGEERERKREEADIAGKYINCAVINFFIAEWSSVKFQSLLPDWDRYSRILLERLANYFTRYLKDSQEYVETIYLGEGNYCCFVDVSKERRISRMQQQLIETVSVVHKCLKEEPYRYVLGVSDICAGESNIKQAVFQARNMVKSSFYLDDAVLYYAGGLGNHITEKLPEPAAALLRRLSSYLQEDKDEEIIIALKEVISRFKEELTSPGVVVKWLKDLDHLFQIDRDIEHYNHIYSIKDVQRICDSYKGAVLLLPVKKVPDNISPAMQNALIYIHENYKKKISLKDVADAIHLNAAYLSTLFNKEMPTGFSKYLLELRMKTAKKLLENTNYKVKEVAEKAGFFDYHYFARAFKDLTGLSPLEYRKNNIRQSDT